MSGSKRGKGSNSGSGAQCIQNMTRIHASKTVRFTTRRFLESANEYAYSRIKLAFADVLCLQPRLSRPKVTMVQSPSSFQARNGPKD
nr:hypothetical protein [Trichoderma harzianum]